MITILEFGSVNIEEIIPLTMYSILDPQAKFVIYNLCLPNAVIGKDLTVFDYQKPVSI